MLNLTPHELEIVQVVLATHIPGVEVLAFGSGVMGHAKPYSDLDLVIVGNGPLSLHTFGMLQEAFQESDLTFRVDLIDWH